MGERVDRAPSQGRLRAQWVALRTLHRLVRFSGHEADHPVYAAGEARLVLPLTARHFRRVVTCHECGRDVIDYRHPIFRSADLRRPATGILCETCTQRRLG